MSEVYFPRHRRSGWRFVALALIVAALVAVVMVLDSDAASRRDRVDTLASGPFVVTREADGQALYLAWVNVGRDMAPRIVERWTSDAAQAWRYGAPDTASAEALPRGGRVVSLREVTL